MSARIFMEHYPLLPVEDKGRLHDPRIRDNFIERIFTLKRWREVLSKKETRGNIIDFHTQNKLLILSHSPKHHQMMGKLVARAKDLPIKELYQQYQAILMEALLNGMRYGLLMDGEMMEPDKAYPLSEFLADVRKGLFSELHSSKPTIDHHRRRLQRHYLEHIKGQLKGSEPIPIKTGYPWMDELVALQSASARSSNFPALVRAALEDLGEQMKGALQKAEDPATKAHLKDCLKGINLILNPKN
jgi:hypothetical protein